MENVVLDTNCLIPAIKRDSIYFPIWRDFIDGRYCLCFTDEILNEYEEIITQRTGSSEVAQNIIRAILNRTNTKHIKIYYRFGLIEADPDDNKFVDCAIKANAKYIVSEDHHFDVLKTIPFPSVNVIGIDEFLKELKSM
jgi:putative PIN family toxin of toxin-antitoxin system